MTFHSDTIRQEVIIDHLNHLLREDDRVLALWLVGSLAQGSGDHFSDVDLYIVVTDESFEAVYDERKDLAQGLGEVLSTFEVNWSNCQLFGVILRNGIEVDLAYCRLDQCEIFKPDCTYMILFDKSGELEERLRHPVLRDVDPTEEIGQITRSSHYHFLHAIHGVARGNLWSALHNIEQLRTLYIRLLAIRLCREFPEWKALEQCDGVQLGELSETFSTYDKESICEAIVTLVALFRSEFALLTQKYEVGFDLDQISHWKDYMKSALDHNRASGG